VIFSTISLILDDLSSMIEWFCYCIIGVVHSLTGVLMISFYFWRNGKGGLFSWSALDLGVRVRRKFSILGKSIVRLKGSMISLNLVQH